MDLFCKCGNDCIKPKSEVLKVIDTLYNPCRNCKEYKLKKFSPLYKQMDITLLDANFGRCTCNKRHLDLVMAHILKIMIEEGIKDEYTRLRDVCVPLITPAFPLNSTPYLPENSLVILSKEADSACAKRIVHEIPEVKGVLKGNLKDTVGVKNSEADPLTYELLDGCDMRCDIIKTPWAVLCLYKYQGQIHIEMPKPVSPKINELKKVLDRYSKPSILDCTCGPGTLGISALISGARRVVFNDLWYPACQTTIMNLETNGFPTNNKGENTGLIATGDNFEVYCLDIKDLKESLNERFDICLVDVFPGVDTNLFTESVQDMCREVIII